MSDLIQTHSDSFSLIQTHADSFRLIHSFRLIQTHSNSFSLIEPHWDSWRRIRRILRKRTLLARIGLMMGMMGMRLKSHFLKRCSLSERLKINFRTFSRKIINRFHGRKNSLLIGMELEYQFFFSVPLLKENSFFFAALVPLFFLFFKDPFNIFRSTVSLWAGAVEMGAFLNLPLRNL